MIGKNILHIFFNKPVKHICKFLENPWWARMNYIYLLQNKPNIYVKFLKIHDSKNILHIFFNKPAKYICKFFWKTMVGRMNYIPLLQNKTNIYVNYKYDLWQGTQAFLLDILHPCVVYRSYFSLLTFFISIQLSVLNSFPLNL